MDDDEPKPVEVDPATLKRIEEECEPAVAKDRKPPNPEPGPEPGPEPTPETTPETAE